MKSICSCACYRGRAVLVYNDAVQRCDCAGAEVRSCRCSGAIVQVQWCDCAGAVVRLCRCSGAIVQVQWCDCVCASICAGAVVRLCMCKYLCKLYIVYNLVCVYTCNLYPTCILLVYSFLQLLAMISFEMTNGANDLEVRSFGSAQVRYVFNVFCSMKKLEYWVRIRDTVFHIHKKHIVKYIYI